MGARDSKKKFPKINIDGFAKGVYITIRSGKVHHTEEIRSEGVMVDFDKDGNVIGIEVLR